MGNGWLANVLDTLGYAGIALVVLGETIFPPVAGAPLVLVGIAVATGHFSLTGAVAAATVGAVTGACIFYALGRRLGVDRARAVVTRLGLLRRSPERFDRTLRWFDDHGSTAVLFGRWIPVVRSLVSIPAGLQEMHRGRFAALTVLGCATWNAAVIGISARVGSSWPRSLTSNHAVEIGALIVAAACCATLAWRRARTHGRLASRVVSTPPRVVVGVEHEAQR